MPPAAGTAQGLQPPSPQHHPGEGRPVPRRCSCGRRGRQQLCAARPHTTPGGQGGQAARRAGRGRTAWRRRGPPWALAAVAPPPRPGPDWLTDTDCPTGRAAPQRCGRVTAVSPPPSPRAPPLAGAAAAAGPQWARSARAVPRVGGVGWGGGSGRPHPLGGRGRGASCERRARTWRRSHDRASGRAGGCHMTCPLVAGAAWRPGAAASARPGPAHGSHRTRRARPAPPRPPVATPAAGGRRRGLRGGPERRLPGPVQVGGGGRRAGRDGTVRAAAGESLPSRGEGL